MQLSDVKQAYFLGIGGIGMSAIARYFMHLGVQVCGYDRTPTQLTRELETEGAQIHYEDLGADVQTILADTHHTLVVITPAIPVNHAEKEWIEKSGYTVYKRAKVLGMISAERLTIGVAGTHGKTTTSTMLAHLLKQSSVDCAAFLGGIATNYGTNLILPHSSSLYTVVEADEFDRSFLQLSPTISIITSTDADHLDIYHQHDALKQSFIDYAMLTHDALFVKKELGLETYMGNQFTNCKTYTYSIYATADYTAKNIHITNGMYEFDLHTPDGVINHLKLGMPGRHNVENAVAASAVALYLGINANELRNGLQSFAGVKRRFEYIIRTPKLVIIDDYAHHPEELKATINSVKEMYPDKKITVVFQPHLYSRTRDFAKEFSNSLSLADEVLLMDIYPARELPLPGIDSKILLEGISANKKFLVQKNTLIKSVLNMNPQVLLMLGAGDIDAMVEPVKNALEVAYGV